MTTEAVTVQRPAFLRFVSSESAGGLALAAAAAVALALANSPWGEGYARLLATVGEVRLGSLVLAKPAVVWINDLWMAVFFFLVGLEIKREVLEGELADRRQLVLPLVAALGGMLLPALIYAAVNVAADDRGTAAAVAMRGWAIPTATDIAFALGVMVLLGPRVPASLKVLLTALAIVDDLGAILIIAFVYTEQLSAPMLAGAAACAAVLVALNRAGVTRVDAYAAVGALMWLCVLKSGVHATLAGVAAALAVPLRRADGSSPLRETEDALHPWVAFLVLPGFAFANAGVSLQGVSWATLTHPVTLGIAAGLLLGKALGVFGAIVLAVRAGWAAWPAQANGLQLLGMSLLAGIGFTMSLFIGELAFEGQGTGWDQRVKLGVLGGSLLAAALGAAVLTLAARGRTPAPPPADPSAA